MNLSGGSWAVADASRRLLRSMSTSDIVLCRMHIDLYTRRRKRIPHYVRSTKHTSRIYTKPQEKALPRCDFSQNLTHTYGVHIRTTTKTPGKRYRTISHPRRRILNRNNQNNGPYKTPVQKKMLFRTQALELNVLRTYVCRSLTQEAQNQNVSYAHGAPGGGDSPKRHKPVRHIKERTP